MSSWPSWSPSFTAHLAREEERHAAEQERTDMLTNGQKETANKTRMLLVPAELLACALAAIDPAGTLAELARAVSKGAPPDVIRSHAMRAYRAFAPADGSFQPVIRARLYGVQKYCSTTIGDRSTHFGWYRVPQGTIEYTEAAIRHALCEAEGQTHDQESGLHHRDHLLCNLAFVAELASIFAARAEPTDPEPPIEIGSIWQWMHQHGYPEREVTGIDSDRVSLDHGLVYLSPDRLRRDYAYVRGPRTEPPPEIDFNLAPAETEEPSRAAIPPPPMPLADAAAAMGARLVELRGAAEEYADYVESRGLDASTLRRAILNAHA